MSTHSCLNRLVGRWHALGRDEDGNVAMIFAACLIPVLGLVGVAIDYSQANALRASLQAAADATALAVSQKAASQSASALQSDAQTFFNSTFTGTNAQNLQVSATYSKSPSSQVVVNASANITPRFMSMWPFNVAQVPVGASSTTTWGNIRLRVALVLDNTGSMKSDGKIDALKTATKNLLTQLKTAATSNGDVYVSIIPFSHDVNVGSSNVNAAWLDWTEFGYCKDAPGQDSQYETKGKCTNAGGTWKTNSDKSSWNGCVTDRGKYDAPNPASAGLGYDQVVDLPNGSSESLWPAHQDSNCPLAMKGLSYDWTAMNTLVDDMYPKGSTNQPLGLVWGWQSLVGGGPLSVPAYDTNYDYKLVIILLSDGLNTEDRWYGNGSSVSTSVDNRMYDANGKGTCKNIKDTTINNKYKITLYTIHVNTDGDPTSMLLKNCASSADKFFVLTSANQIITTFDQIGTNLSQLRVAK
jgi:Flp pilus assembly protein TadG